MPKEIKFNIRLNVDGKEHIAVATSSAKEMREAWNGAASSAEKLQQKILKFASAGAGIRDFSESISNLQERLAGLTAAYQNAERGNTKLATIMKQRMEATDADVESVKKVIAAQTKLGIVGGSVQKEGAQQVATFLKHKSSLEALIPAMNNLIAQQRGVNATGQDAVAIGNLMGKAMQGQTSALRRVGITFSDTEEKIMKMGTESERAAMLAQIITNNVGEMNVALSETSAGKIKNVENSLGALKVKIGELTSTALPFVTFAAQTVTLFSSVMRLHTGFKTLAATIASFSLVSSLSNGVIKSAAFSMNLLSKSTVTARAASLLFTGNMGRSAAALRVFTATTTSGAFATTALKMALRGLLISTGVGVAIAGVTAAVEMLSGSADKCKKGVEELSAADEAARQKAEQMRESYADIRAEMSVSMAKLKEFAGGKEEEKKLVGEMNDKYGEAMGYYNTVEQWYKALVANSDAYCEQMIREIQIRDLANEAAKKKKTADDLKENLKKGAYSTQRERRKVGTGQIDAGDGRILPVFEMKEIAGTSEREKKIKELTAATKDYNATLSKMNDLVKESSNVRYKHTDGWQSAPTAPKSVTPKTGTSTGRTGKTEKPGKEEKAALLGSIDWYEEQIRKLDNELSATADVATARHFLKQKERLEAELGKLKVNIGIEKPKEKDLLEGLNLELKPLELDVDVTGADKLEETAEALQALKGTDLTDFESVKKTLKSIDEITEPTTKGFAAAGAAAVALGGAMQQLGQDSGAAKAGMVMAAIGNIVLSFAQALKSCTNWIEWLAFGISGAAMMASLIATVSGFKDGGIVGGNSKSGDKLIARVNSGEMILNSSQQARLWKIANGYERALSSTDTGQERRSPDFGTLQSLAGAAEQNINVTFTEPKWNGTRMVLGIRNVRRVMGKSGRNA